MRAVRGLVAVGLVVVLGGCSSAGKSAKSNGESAGKSAVADAKSRVAQSASSLADAAAGTPSSPAFKGSFTVDKPAAASGAFVDSTDGIGVASCAEAAAKGNGGSGHGAEGSFQIPGPPLTDPAAGHLSVSVEIPAYHGPGDYPTDALSGHVQVEKGAFYSVADGAATSKVTVKPDGSGELTFKGAKDSAGGGTADGSITWTCTTS